MADFNVVEIRSADVGDDTFRSIKGYEEITPFLVLEQIRHGATEGDPPELLRSWNLRAMVGGRQFEHPSEGDELDGLVWRGDILEFVHTGEKLKERCRVSRITEGKPTVSCRPIR